MEYLINENGTIREMTEEEIASLPTPEPMPEPELSELDSLKQRQETTEQALQDLILTVMGEM